MKAIVARFPRICPWLLLTFALLLPRFAFAQSTPAPQAPSPPVAPPATSTAPPGEATGAPAAAEAPQPNVQRQDAVSVQPEPLPAAQPSVLAPAVPNARTETQLATPPAPAAAPAPAPAAPPLTAVVASVPIRATGIVWAGVFATQGVQTFGYLNASAPTSAANPAVLADPNHALLSFQVQQTRAGVVLGEGTPFKGTVEIDFIHFDQSSPTTQAYPRIRQALLEWKMTDTQKLFLGQTWDIFGNASGPSLVSHSFNLVGTLFQAGNVGFMRHQLGWMGSFGDIELATAAGFQGANSGPSFNDIEKGTTPTGSARVMYHLPGTLGVIGLSGIGSALRFTSGADKERRGAGGGELFADLTLGPLNIHSEVYAAQNLANMGALNLSQGRYGTDVADVGGYLSGRLTHGQHAFTAMFGVAGVLHPSDVAPSYTPGSAGPPAVAAAPNPTAGPGMSRNMSAHVGYWYSPVRGLSIVLEPYLYASRFKLAAVDVGRVSADNVSFGVSLGSMFQF